MYFFIDMLSILEWISENTNTTNTMLIWALSMLILKADTVAWSSVSIFPLPNVKIPEEITLPIIDLIEYWGYPAEEHEVLTDDGYYLRLHRIPHGKAKNMTSYASKGPILLHHGILLDSTSFVSNLPHQSLGFILAEEGFDVWMGNSRGNIHSKRHQFHAVNSSQFWDFSWDEMAKYDLPAMIDYVLKSTNQKQLIYVGYSQGSMVAFAGFSENIQLQKKIKKMFALAPATRLSHITPWLHIAALFEPLMRKAVIERFHIQEFLGFNQFWEGVAEIACPLNLDFCQGVMLFLCGGNAANFNRTRTPMYVMHVPMGISYKAFQQYLQSIVTGDFKKFDYGLLGNMIMYGKLRPPVYNLANLKVPVIMFSGSADPLAAPLDVEWTKGQLPIVNHHFIIPGYGHFDFLMGLDAKDKVYDKLIKLAK